MEALERCIARIEVLNDSLRAFAFTDYRGARHTAREADARLAAGESLGPLGGVPIGIKATEPVAGMPNAYPDIFTSSISGSDAPHVSLLRTADAVIVGKTAVPEYRRPAQYYTTSEAFGVTRNPWNLGRTPGGSSGGSAAAVAAGMVPIATGIDSGGSVRLPASLCGIVGFKPTNGVAPSLRPAAWWSSPGILASCVDDVRLWLHAVAPPDEIAALTPLRAMSFAYSRDLGYGTCDSSVGAVVDTAVSRLSRSEEFRLVDRVVQLVDPEAAWSTFVASIDGSEVQPSSIARAKSVAAHNEEVLQSVFEVADFLLCPTWGPAVPFDDGTSPLTGELVAAERLLTWAFNLTSHPVVSIPCGLDEEGLPVGLQVVGRRGADLLLLEAAKKMETILAFQRAIRTS